MPQARRSSQTRVGVAGVDARDGELAGLQGEEGVQVARERGLAGAVLAHDRHELARRHVERDAAQRGAGPVRTHG